MEAEGDVPMSGDEATKAIDAKEIREEVLSDDEHMATAMDAANFPPPLAIANSSTKGKEKAQEHASECRHLSRVLVLPVRMIDNYARI